MSVPTYIKNIIFDFGGVLLNIDYNLTAKAFGKLGLTGFDKLYSQAGQKDLFDDLETGKISPQVFRNEIRKFIPANVSDKDIDGAWNAMLLDFQTERLHLLEQVRKTYRIFLLSNTNEIHFKAFSGYMKEKFKQDIFSEVFEKTYLSHQIHSRKPDAKTFQIVLEENKLDKTETLFIDDSIQHIEGANRVGLNTIFLEKGKTISDIFI